MGQWRIVFFIAAFVYIFTATFYNIFGSGTRQPWDNPDNDNVDEPLGDAKTITSSMQASPNLEANGNSTAVHRTSNEKKE